MTKVILIGILFTTSLLIILPAYTSWWWIAKVLVTEHAHWLAVITFITLLALGLQGASPTILALLSMGIIVFSLPTIDVIFKSRGQPYKVDLVDIFYPRSLPLISSQEIPFKNQGESLPINYYRAPGTKPAPLVVVIYGGSWTNGTRNDLAELNFFLAEAGFNVAAITYRHAPETKFPGGVDDSLAATRYLISRATELGIDPENIFLAGRSAGGQIASIAAIRGKAQGLSIRGAVLIYAPTDLVWAYENTSPWHIISGVESIGAYLGEPLNKSTSAFYESASPAFAIQQDSPPHLLIHGIKDDLVSIHHADTMMDKIKRLNLKGELFTLRWASHGFDYFFRSPHATAVKKRILHFLKSQGPFA